MKNINSHRVFHRNQKEPDTGGKYVVYWMQSAHRLHYNFALEYAVGWANKLDKPLLLYEELKNDYPWASGRIHTFYLEGMQEIRDYCREHNHNYLSFVEEEPETNKRAYLEMLRNACCLVTDEFPVYFIRERNRWLGEHLDIPVYTVDNNGLIPLGLTEKDPYNAYFFRKIMQRNFVEAYTHPPKQNPLEELKNREEIDIKSLRKKLPTRGEIPEEIPKFINELPIDHEVKPLEIKGTRQAALGKLGRFVQYGLPEYDQKRNDPDESKVSGLSPWLHFGKISEHEIVQTVLDHQPKGWDLGDISFNKGSTGGFFNGDPNIDSFLDEVITWREVGFHFAHHRPDYAEFESLPDWALETLRDHKDDPREWIYSYEELENAQTHDEIWNAAQRQLRQEGIIHNYLRMLWGKKVIEWTPDPQTALEYLIELNNKFAIDGRDPNSYSGIFWCFGRFDRAWQERPIFGKVRYMTSKSTRRKVKLKKYLDRFGDQQALL
ncbi:hypothetical protein ACG2F4_11300 [Halalkalibaculum sp. DA3122]|uniref:hypothetical protein n=1 Tax=Halalkalibaculum sp. DA3122 TaxID=3373607 RepID=UPI003754E3D4